MRILAYSITVALLSCAPSQNASVKVPADLVIRYAEGGGFTGRWTGVVIRSDGSVREWSPTVHDSVSTPIGTLSASVLSDLWRSVESHKIMELSASQEAGNMTRSISISAGGKEAAARWPFGPPTSGNTMHFAAFYEECRQAVSRLKQ